MVPKVLHDLTFVQNFKLILFLHGSLTEPILVPRKHQPLACLRFCRCYFFYLDSSFTSFHPSVNTLHSTKVNSSIRVQFKHYTYNSPKQVSSHSPAIIPSHRIQLICFIEVITMFNYIIMCVFISSSSNRW